MEGCALAKKLLVCLIFALGEFGELWTLTRAPTAKEPLWVPDEIYQIYARAISSFAWATSPTAA
ncbi:MAG: hypothetical protein ACFNVQ_05565 [Campylobacter sp.]|uniref:hypothetical protein n=1 Tax=uncultured Campylobacter sp. TaxID=218934 RepID=UPI002620CB16|nr:hypothetical protein [uncultured Campylobacter sp.]